MTQLLLILSRRSYFRLMIEVRSYPLVELFNHCCIFYKTTRRIIIHNSELFQCYLHNSAVKIINGQNGTISFPSINYVKHRQFVAEVFKCLNGLGPKKLENPFERLSHKKCTQGNRLNLMVPHLRTEIAKQTFMYQGVQTCTKLPADLKNENSVLQ